MKQTRYQDVLAETRDRIYSYLYYLLKNREDAEDVCQEVYIRLWNHWDRVDLERAQAWLMRVAHNRAIDLIRQNKTASTQDRLVTPLDQVDARLATEGTPETVMERSDKQRSVLEALEQLPAKTQSVLLMHYFKGMKYTEIGESLDMSLAAVKVSVHRGKKMLRDALIAQSNTTWSGS